MTSMPSGLNPVTSSGRPASSPRPEQARAASPATFCGTAGKFPSRHQLANTRSLRATLAAKGLAKSSSLIRRRLIRSCRRRGGTRAVCQGAQSGEHTAHHTGRLGAVITPGARHECAATPANYVQPVRIRTSGSPGFYVPTQDAIHGSGSRPSGWRHRHSSQSLPMKVVF